MKKKEPLNLLWNEESPFHSSQYSTITLFKIGTKYMLKFKIFNRDYEIDPFQMEDDHDPYR